ncbi:MULTISPECIES: ABC transporter ATP-binding protein [unclassified Paenibacillus]|uniref:ABC transporter ATP-binding protein n=1 Tax=unclassified Paenibacillus TaxID=185978 RepID=UPI00104863DA|nr:MULTISPECIES: ABC transporter ATP-binding protein [unclassified Paenibacillus]NIK69789.1 iron complex transport system ATP-binding protein [Paenibacillus sp. BK720]TCM97626.1 iron complex transport system ATP-binding protein [Paenibacillus sp. BK033]
MSMLEAKGISLSYGGASIFEQLNLSIPDGKITVLIGSNGCGKSTLLRALSKLLKPTKGEVMLNGKDLSSMPAKTAAKQLSLLPQGPVAPEGLTVLQLVKQGRYPYQTWLQQWSKQDEEAVQSAMRATGIEELAERSVSSLSGGQRQRAWIAMTLAQQTGIILLDEPTTYLDLTHQIEVLDLLQEMNERDGRTIVMVLHDINLACRYADHIAAVKNGAIYAQGSPSEIVDASMIEDVFHLKCDVISDPLYDTPMIVPHGRKKAK